MVNTHPITQYGNKVFFAGFDSNVHVEIFALNGERLFKTNISKANSLDLTKTGLSKGVYMVRVSDSKYSRSVRIQR